MRNRKHLMRGLVTAVAAAALMAVSGPPFPAAGGSQASSWHIGYYTPSSVGTLSNAQAPQPATGVASLDFTGEANTALLVTHQKAKNPWVLANLNGKTGSAKFTISDAGPFTYYGEGTPSNPCGTPANTRLYFETSNAGGFDYTHYWWSNPSSAVLTDGSLTVTAQVLPAEWSDWNGQNGVTVPAEFAKAAGDVGSIGLSFGGGCFFENGVGTTTGTGTLTLDSFTATPPYPRELAVVAGPSLTGRPRPRCYGVSVAAVAAAA